MQSYQDSVKEYSQAARGAEPVGGDARLQQGQRGFDGEGTLRRLALASGGMMFSSQTDLLIEVASERQERGVHWPRLFLLAVLSVVLELAIRCVRHPKLG